MAIVINGSGTVTGISVGGLPDGIVDAGTLATNSVDSAELIDGAVDNSHIDAMAASKLTGLTKARCVYSGWDSNHGTAVGTFTTPTFDYVYTNFNTDYCSAYNTDEGVQIDTAGQYLVLMRVMQLSDSASNEYQNKITINGGVVAHTYGSTDASKWMSSHLHWTGALTDAHYIQTAHHASAGVGHYLWHQGTTNAYSALSVIYLGDS